MQAVLLRVAPMAHRFARRMCAHEADAEDVLQDTLVAVTKHLGAFGGRAALSSWVFTLARSACSRRRRGPLTRGAVGLEALVDASSEAPPPDAQAEQRELARVLGDALAELRDDHREVILLRDVEGLSAADAAVALEVSVDALKSRLHRARAALREAVERRLGDGARLDPRCPDVARLWSELREGSLSPGDCAAMQAHVDGCPTCRLACHTLRGALQGLPGRRRRPLRR